MKKKNTMISVSTKTGDKGESGLANGQRLRKGSMVFEVLGTLDELNSWIGLSVTKLDDAFKNEKMFLLETQDNLFHLGAELARSPKTKLPEKTLTILEEKLEKLQATMKDGWTTKFMYPGGCEAAAILDITRTVCRRLERTMVSFSNQEELRPFSLKYINRLSDYLFVLRCFVNQTKGIKETKFEYAQKLVDSFTS